MPQPPSPPDDVIRIFVSYARKDKRWFDDEYKYHLIPWLIESMKRLNVVFWYDKELGAGEVFTRRIQEEIDKADIAVLIVSQPFLNSEYIEKFELPRIRARAERRELVVVPVLVEPCSWEDDDFLRERNMLPGKPTPLINYTEREADWAQVKFDLVEGIKKLVKKIRADRVQAGELRKRDAEEAEAHAKAAAAKAKADEEAKAAHVAEKQQQEIARRAAKEEEARVRAINQKAEVDQGEAGNGNRKNLVLSVRNLRKVRKSHGHWFELHVPEMEVRQGEFVVLLGLKGWGKSTLLDMLGLILRADEADQFEIILPGSGEAFDIMKMGVCRRARMRARYFGYVLQRGGLLGFHSVGGNGLMPVRLNGLCNAIILLSDLAETIGIGSLLHRLPANLAGGERQKTAIMRALIHHPLIVLADEPTAAVDQIMSKQEMRELKQEANARGSAVISVTDSPDLMTGYADRIYEFRVVRVPIPAGFKSATLSTILPRPLPPDLNPNPTVLNVPDANSPTL